MCNIANDACVLLLDTRISRILNYANYKVGEGDGALAALAKLAARDL